MGTYVLTIPNSSAVNILVKIGIVINAIALLNKFPDTYKLVFFIIALDIYYYFKTSSIFTLGKTSKLPPLVALYKFIFLSFK